MAVTSKVSLSLAMSGDVSLQQIVTTSSNASGAGKADVVTLASGANTISVPTSGTVPIGVLIIPPSGNATALTLKGVAGDTGIALHLTEPTYLPLAASVVSFVLNAGAIITGLRLIWN